MGDLRLQLRDRTRPISPAQYQAAQKPRPPRPLPPPPPPPPRAPLHDHEHDHTDPPAKRRKYEPLRQPGRADFLVPDDDLKSRRRGFVVQDFSTPWATEQQVQQWLDKYPAVRLGSPWPSRPGRPPRAPADDPLPLPVRSSASATSTSCRTIARRAGTTTCASSSTARPSRGPSRAACTAPTAATAASPSRRSRTRSRGACGRAQPSGASTNPRACGTSGRTRCVELPRTLSPSSRPWPTLALTPCADPRDQGVDQAASTDLDLDAVRRGDPDVADVGGRGRGARDPVSKRCVPLLPSSLFSPSFEILTLFFPRSLSFCGGPRDTCSARHTRPAGQGRVGPQARLRRRACACRPPSSRARCCSN